MSEKIDQLTDLKDLSDDELSEKFVASLDVIFQYAKSDIVETIDTKSQDVLKNLRQVLWDLFKINFPAYANRKPINRIKKHLIVKDIFQLGYSITNEDTCQDIDQVFTKDETPADCSDEESPEDAPQDLAQVISIITKLQQEVNSLKKSNKELHKKLNGSPVCSCKCLEKSRAGDTPTPSTSTECPPSHQERKDSKNPVDPKVVIDIEDHSSAPSSIESDDEGWEQQKSRKKKHIRNKTVSVRSSKQPESKGLLAAKIKTSPGLKAAHSNVKREVYVGNLDPNSTAADIIAHIKNDVKISNSDIRELSKREDVKSFCLKVCEDDYDKVLQASWPKGIKVRQFYPHSQRGTVNASDRKPSHNKTRHRYANKDTRSTRNSKIRYQPFRTNPQAQSHQAYYSYDEYDQFYEYERQWPSLPSNRWDHEWYDSYDSPRW